jgi:hypothetical protein
MGFSDGIGKGFAFVTDDELREADAAVVRNGYKEYEFGSAVGEVSSEPPKPSDPEGGSITIRCYPTGKIKTYTLGPNNTWAQDFIRDLDGGFFKG